MTTEPIILLPNNLTSTDAVKWMREKLQDIDHLSELYVRRDVLVAQLENIKAEITEYTNKSAIQIQSK
ncbi:hypothetical protein M997_2376 [Proteus hauseri ATCC 700826]|uniref:Uncharacterized protein n=1 Tax=Proteus hauseri ATCC 700826 TaxID=1354271 RepID=A0AAJ3HRI5_PROHU|nr:hypothetical protein [Proteus hauseri]OAT46121.1 hypothetical protein M997_2376 [Proteus hauseri ATCC 700826]